MLKRGFVMLIHRFVDKYSVIDRRAFWAIGTRSSAEDLDHGDTTSRIEVMRVTSRATCGSAMRNLERRSTMYPSLKVSVGAVAVFGAPWVRNESHGFVLRVGIDGLRALASFWTPWGLKWRSGHRWPLIQSKQQMGSARIPSAAQLEF